MDETSQLASVRDTEDGQRFLRALRLIAVSALLLVCLSLALRYLSPSENPFEDGIYLLYDGLIYGLAAISFGRGELFERATALMLSAVFAVGGCQGSYDIWNEIAWTATGQSDTAPSAAAIVFATSAILETALLFRFRASHEPLMKATWVSTRNSAAIALAGAIVPILYQTHSGGGLRFSSTA